MCKQGVVIGRSVHEQQLKYLRRTSSSNSPYPTYLLLVAFVFVFHVIKPTGTTLAVRGIAQPQLGFVASRAVLKADVAQAFRRQDVL